MAILHKRTASLAKWLGCLLLIQLTGPGHQISHAQASSEDIVFSNIVLIEDRLEDVQRKLGSPACIVPEIDPSHTAYIYQAPDGLLMSFSLNTVSAHVDHDRITAFRVVPPRKIPAECRKAITASHVISPIPGPVHEGPQIGASLESVMDQYGKPETIEKDGAHIRATFSRSLFPNHHLIWTCDFEHDRMTEWSVEAFPVFFELPG